MSNDQITPEKWVEQHDESGGEVEELGEKLCIVVRDNKPDLRKEQLYIVIRDNEPDLRFVGQLLGSAESSGNAASPLFSGKLGEWEELRLWLTKKGTWVCQREQIQTGDLLRPVSVMITKTFDANADIVDFFGWGKVAKALYEAAEINGFSMHMYEDID